MNIRIQPSAVTDLADVFKFYENQQAGLGNYFLESLFSDIDSSSCTQGFTLLSMASTDYSPNGFPTQSTILKNNKRSLSELSWTADGIPIGYVND